jgi:hypothetical protein
MHFNRTQHADGEHHSTLRPRSGVRQRPAGRRAGPVGTHQYPQRPIASSAGRQRAVSGNAHCRLVPVDHTRLVHRLVGGDPLATAEVLQLAATSTSTALLVAAAIVSGDQIHLYRAAPLATTARERQLVVLADAHLRGDTDLLDVLVRDHLADHPDHLLASWIAGQRR